MEAPVYFISDLHLDDSRPQVISAFEQFLSERGDAAALYILGDFFEAWIGDDDDSELAARVAASLRAYTDRGPRVYLMHGNRDFLIGEDFSSRSGATLLHDPATVTVQDRQLLLMHGDSLCTLDIEYQTFRAQARSPQWQEQILALPLSQRRELAAQLRSVSKDAGSRKADDIMDVTESEVLAQMENAGVNTLIHGHTHRPARHKNTNGERWVLGDWDQSGWYLKLSEGKIELVEFNIIQ